MLRYISEDHFCHLWSIIPCSMKLKLVCFQLYHSSSPVFEHHILNHSDHEKNIFAGKPQGNSICLHQYLWISTIEIELTLAFLISIKANNLSMWNEISINNVYKTNWWRGLLYFITCLFTMSYCDCRRKSLSLLPQSDIWHNTLILKAKIRLHTWCKNSV